MNPGGSPPRSVFTRPATGTPAEDVDQERADAVLKLGAHVPFLLREHPARAVRGGHRVVRAGEHHLVERTLAEPGVAVAAGRAPKGRLPRARHHRDGRCQRAGDDQRHGHPPPGEAFQSTLSTLSTSPAWLTRPAVLHGQLVGRRAKDEAEQLLKAREREDRAGRDREHRERGRGPEDQADAGDDEQRAPGQMLPRGDRWAREPHPGGACGRRQPGALEQRVRRRREDQAHAAETKRQPPEPTRERIEHADRGLLRERRHGERAQQHASRRDQQQEQQAEQREIEGRAPQRPGPARGERDRRR